MDSLKLGELKTLAKERNVKGYSKLGKQALLDALKATTTEQQQQICKEEMNGVCKLPQPPSPAQREDSQIESAQKPKKREKKSKEIEEKSDQSIDIDWDLIVKKISKNKLLTYGELIGAPVAAKMSKQDALDEILYHVTRKVYNDLMMDR